MHDLNYCMPDLNYCMPDLNYCGITAELLRNYCGITAELLRNYCGITVKQAELLYARKNSPCPGRNNSVIKIIYALWPCSANFYFVIMFLSNRRLSRIFINFNFPG